MRRGNLCHGTNESHLCGCDVTLWIRTYVTHLSYPHTQSLVSTDWRKSPPSLSSDHECFQLHFHSQKPEFMWKQLLFVLSGGTVTSACADERQKYWSDRDIGPWWNKGCTHPRFLPNEHCLIFRAVKLTIMLINWCTDVTVSCCVLNNTLY